MNLPVMFMGILVGSLMQLCECKEGLKRGVHNMLHTEKYECCVIKNDSPVPGETDYGFPYKTSLSSNTPYDCISHCQNQGPYTYVGVSGKSCFCGDLYFKIPSMGCYNRQLMRCPGDPLQVCGGEEGVTSVYRVCPVGFWGSNCEKSCEKCGDYGCHTRNGTCLKVCRAGKTGPQCKQSCEKQGFGPGCGLDQWNCLQHRVDPIMGYCLEGCRFFITNFGPFCVEESMSPHNPALGCPMCTYCAEDMCRGTGGPSYYQCPKKWMGTKCKACKAGRWGERCDKLCEPVCAECVLKTGQCTRMKTKEEIEDDDSVLKVLRDDTQEDKESKVLTTQQAMTTIWAVLGVELLAGAMLAVVIFKRKTIMEYWNNRDNGSHLTFVGPLGHSNHPDKLNAPPQN